MYIKNDLLFRIFTVKMSQSEPFFDVELNGKIENILLTHCCGKKFKFDDIMPTFTQLGAHSFKFDLHIGNTIDSSEVRLARVEELLESLISNDNRYTRVKVKLN